jgi:hypothetical protein
VPHLGMDCIGVPDRACARSISGLRQIDPFATVRSSCEDAGTPEVAMALVLVVILAALIALIVVTAGLVIVQRRGDRRRAHQPAGGESIRRRSG